MTRYKKPPGAFRFAVAAAIVLAFLLSGCASSRPTPAAEAAADGWGRCDRSRMVRVMLLCWETRAEPVSGLGR